MLPIFEPLFFFPLIIALSLWAYRIRVLDWWGAAAAIAIGAWVFLGGGWQWFITLTFFFVISSLFTRFRYDYKRSLGLAQEKGGARGWPNVAANGSIASLLGLAEFLVGADIFAIAFLGAVATATGDTLATEIGLLSKRLPRPLLAPRRRALPGESGAVSPLGLASALLGAGSVTLLSIAIGVVRADPAIIIISVVMGGFIGTIVDSALGSRLQRVGRCDVCNKLTEARSHHSSTTQLVRGVRLIDNNIVNLLATASGGTAAALLYMII